MKIAEIASAEDQQSLWKTFSDTVWAAVQQQAQAEAAEREDRAAQRPRSLKSHPATAGGHSAPPPLRPRPPTSPAADTPKPQTDSGHTLKHVKTQTQKIQPKPAIRSIPSKPPLTPAQQRALAAGGTPHTP